MNISPALIKIETLKNGYPSNLVFLESGKIQLKSGLRLLNVSFENGNKMQRQHLYLGTLILLLVLFNLNLYSQNWSTEGGCSARTGNSEITGPSDVTTPFWEVTDATYTLLGEAVYTFGDLFVTSRVSSGFSSALIECRDLQTGALKWTSPFISDTSKLYCVGFNEDAVYAMDYSKWNKNIKVYALNASDGSIKWTGEVTSYSYGAVESAVYACNRDIIVNGQGTGYMGGSTMRMNKDNGKVVWTNEEWFAVAPIYPLAATETTVYRITGTITEPKKLTAIDIETGVTLYKSDELPGDGDQECQIVIGNDGRIYFWRDGGELHSFTDNGSGFTLNWTYVPVNPHPGYSNAYIAIEADQNILTFDEGRMVRINHDDGSLMSTSGIEFTGGTITVGADSSVYVNNKAGSFFSLTYDLQSVIWEYNLNQNQFVFGNPVLAKDGIMIFTGAGSSITAFKPAINRKPVADFRSSTRRILTGESVNFFDQSSYEPDAWEWTFTGASTTSSIEKNPTNITYSEPGIYEVNLIASNSHGSDNSVKTCYIEVTTEVGLAEDEQPGKISIYPNPASDYLKIEVNDNLVGSEFTVSDLAGKQIMKGRLQENMTIVNAKQLKTGMYFLTIKADSKKIVKKIIVRK